ncbi:MAG: DUF2207 domain-containing protein [Euryarchaeota archaeon]|nr:DUF2207 domain-containing protein [Euryarchaeota archaeon]
MVFLFSVSLIPNTSHAEDRSYSIPYANIELFLQENGNLHVKENIHYSFSGTYQGVYRDIPLKAGERIENLKINTEGAYSSYEINNKGNMESIKIYLYSDPQKTAPITDRDVDVIIEYDFINVIKIYDDIAELQYKLWGEQWAVDVGKVNANIHLKSNEGVKYWLNPPYYVENSFWQGSTLQITTKKISSGRWFELRMAIPKNQFSNNTTYAQRVRASGLSEIERIQNEYANELNFKNILYLILAVLMLLSIITPVIIYYKFGREPKIDYQAEYERDLPTDDPPAVVNAISGKGLGKRVGEPNMDGFRATIMDLINRGYLNLVDTPSKLEYEGDQSIKLKINKDKDLTELKYFELDVISFLRGFARGGVISLDQMKNDLKNREIAKSFRDSYNVWKDDLKREFLSDETMKRIFIKKGDTYLKIYGVVALVTAIIVAYMTIFDPLPVAVYPFYASIILGIVALVSLIMPQQIAGQWTTHGEEYDAKWHKFKKYIQDFSLIKEYPPASVKIWNKFLVYATALGIADRVRKSMELAVPGEDLAKSDIYIFHYYGGYILLSSSLDDGMSKATGGDFGGAGGIGGVGGGSGGGGGGAF